MSNEGQSVSEVPTLEEVAKDLTDVIYECRNIIDGERRDEHTINKARKLQIGLGRISGLIGHYATGVQMQLHELDKGLVKHIEGKENAMEEKNENIAEEVNHPLQGHGGRVSSFGKLEWDFKYRFNEVRDILISERNRDTCQEAEKSRKALKRFSDKLSDFTENVLTNILLLDSALEKYIGKKEDDA